MKIHRSFLGLNWWLVAGVIWWVIMGVVALSIGVLVVRAVLHRIEPPQLVSLSAQHRMEQPQLVSFSGQPVYKPDRTLESFPIVLVYRQTEKRFDGKPPASWITTDTFDLVKQELHTMALNGNTIAYGAVREDFINVLGALYRSVHNDPLPEMQNSAFRGEPPPPPNAPK